jgi:hypothetical protein
MFDACYPNVPSVDFYARAKIIAQRAEVESAKGRFDVAVHSIDEAVRLMGLAKEKTASAKGNILKVVKFDEKSYEALSHYYRAQQFMSEGRYFLAKREARTSYSRLRLLRGNYRKGLVNTRLEKSQRLLEEAEDRFNNCEHNSRDLQDMLGDAVSRENYQRAAEIKKMLAGK